MPCLAEELGFKRITILTPAEHDYMIGYVSQLCHAIAVSLMCASDNTELAKYTGDSFRDLTRIAHINDKMWAELFLWNKDNLISEIDMFSDALQSMREKLVQDDREGLEEMFRLSTERRSAFDKKATLGNTAQFPPNGLSNRSGSCGTASALPKCSIMSGCGGPHRASGTKPLALCDRCLLRFAVSPPAALTFAAQSIICAFGLASAAPRSPYRHLELCGIALVL